MVKILLILYAVTIVVIFIKYNKLTNEIKRLKGNSFSTKENEVLKDILDLSFSEKDLLTLELVAKNIIRILSKYYKIDFCTILINKGRLITAASNVYSRFILDIEKYCDAAVKDIDVAGKIRCCENYLDYESAKERKIKYSYIIPLSNGALYIENKEDYKENGFELEFFKIVIKNINLILANAIYHDKITSLAMRDNLTQMYNRNYMTIHIQKEIDSDKRFSIAIFDIDHFKKFNDKYGHEFGDLVLVEVSKFIKNNIRKCDEVYRWGGEEFIIFFYNTDCKKIYERLDNIRENLSNYQLRKNDVSTNVTASFGIAEYPKDGTNIEELISCADKAMYYSKEHGRNKVTIYEIEGN